MRYITLFTLLSFICCFQALGQTENNFQPPTFEISHIQSEELQVALEAFNLHSADNTDLFIANDLINRKLVIRSITSGSWNNPSTWDCSCTPNYLSDVIIDLGHNVSVSENAQVKNLTITSDGVLNLDGPSTSKLYINGDWSAGGIINSGIMQVQFSGNVTQTVSGNAECYNALIDNGNQIDLVGSLKIMHHLELNNGVINVSTGELRLLYNELGPASLIVGVLGSCIGEITREFQLHCEKDALHRVGFGMLGVTVEDLLDDIPTSGFPGSDNPLASMSNISFWNESSVQMEQIVSINDTLMSGMGYSLALPAGTYNIDFSGTIQDVNFSLPVSYSNPIAFNLISNPTQSYIDLSLLFENFSGLESSMNIWDNVTRNFNSYASHFGLNDQNQYLAPGAALWIRAIATPSATLNAAMHASSIEAESNAVNSNPELSYMRWLLESDGNSDEIVIAISDNSSNLFDVTLDANNWKGDQFCDLMTAPYNNTPGSPFYSIQVLPAIAGNTNATIGLGISTQVPAQTTKHFSLKLIELKLNDYCAWITSAEGTGGFPLSEGMTLGLTIEGGASSMISITNDIRWNVHVSPPSVVDIVSSGCDSGGAAAVEVLGSGAGPWDYTLNDAEGNLLSSLTGVNGPGLFNELSSGIYSATVSNQGEYTCGVNDHSFDVIAQESMTLDINATFFCEDAQDSEATVKIIGGGTEFQYAWSNGDTLNVATGLTGGQYSVVVSDAWGCTDTSTVDVISAPSIDLIVTSPGCNGTGPTSIEVNGNGDEPWVFTYFDADSLEIANFQDGSGSAILSNLPTGAYTVVANDSGHWGCPPRVETAVVVEPTVITAVITSVNIGCDGLKDGSAELQGLGGVKPYNYVWSTGADSSKIGNLEVGLYSGILTDAFGCADTATVEITAVPQVEVDFRAPVLPFTSGDGSGYTVAFTNLTQGATGFSWFFGDNSDPSFDIHAVHKYLEAGTYDVFLNAWNNFCSNTIRQVITIDKEDVIVFDTRQEEADEDANPDANHQVFDVEAMLFEQINSPIATQTGYNLELGSGFSRCEVRAYDLSGRSITPVFKPEIDGVVRMEADVWPSLVLIRLTDPVSGAAMTWKMVR